MHRSYSWLGPLFTALAFVAAPFVYVLRPVAEFAVGVWRLAFPASTESLRQRADLPSEVSYSAPLRSRAAAFISRRLQRSSTHAAPSLGVGLAGAFITG